MVLNESCYKDKHKENKYLIIYLALLGKFWLRSRMTFNASNFGTDMTLAAAWKLRSVEITTSH